MRRLRSLHLLLLVVYLHATPGLSVAEKTHPEKAPSHSDEALSLFSEEDEFDEDDEEIMGSLFTSFLADSETQLILDTDFFKHFFSYAEAYRLGIEDGNLELAKYAVKFVDKLREFDVSLVLDAMGKVPSGITAGNNLWVGSWNTCRKIHVVKNNQGQKWNGQYCMAHLEAYERNNPLKALDTSGPVDAHCFKKNNMSEEDEDDGRCFTLVPMLNFGVCMPDSCTNYDVTRMITFEAKENAMSSSWLSMFALYFLTYTIIMMVFGTLYDLFIYQKQIDRLHPTDQKNHLFIRVVLAYSVYTNGLEILTTSKKDGALAVDSFFLLSGLLASYLFFKKLMKDKIIRDAQNPLMWLMIYVKRYTRLTPTYAVIMLFDVTLFTYVSYGPFWRPVELQGCRISWWTNFLYLNNFLLQDKECCMGWTWYLANDIQLHYIVAPILFIAFAKNIRWGMLIGGLMMAVSSAIKLWIIFENDYPPAPILTVKLQIVKTLDAYWKDVYVRPYVRCGPFIVGVTVGFLLNYLTREQKDLVVKIPKVNSVQLFKTREREL
ncbi:unnamed protein product [Nippostrongylus brasiliensis]|uniref:Nose resistant to fluoxetine protein 6 (inferred by orthology to a C. elegans protein) n=1 Tax=Nippostrongylus brasiliensis TaxID=27835 RepID=A0A0N4YMP9_NIPBR|nr:unnamed protein product [Nippostrongylus brasiliensis]